MVITLQTISRIRSSLGRWSGSRFIAPNAPLRCAKNSATSTSKLVTDVVDTRVFIPFVTIVIARRSRGSPAVQAGRSVPLHGLARVHRERVGADRRLRARTAVIVSDALPNRTPPLRPV